LDKRHSPTSAVRRDVVATLVRQALNLSSDREANNIVNVVTASIVSVLTAHIEIDSFTLKLPRFGKFEVRHRKAKMREIPLTGKIQMTADKRKVKFIPLARLGHLEHREVDTASLKL
jgi:nucleoid DNA-binding protein